MDRNKLSEALFDTACSVLEEGAYVLVDPPGEEIQAASGPANAARVEFHGHFAGALLREVPEELALEMAQNMLNEPDDSEGAARDAVKELLNMVCGSLLPAIAGTEPEFAIGAPEEVGRGEVDAAALDPNAVGAELSVDGRGVRLALLTKEVGT